LQLAISQIFNNSNAINNEGATNVDMLSSPTLGMGNIRNFNGFDAPQANQNLPKPMASVK
jgi:hypothetical protein